MKNIIYVTGNYGKYVSVKEYFEEKNIGIDFYEYDFEEIEINNIEKISRNSKRSKEKKKMARRRNK